MPKEIMLKLFRVGEHVGNLSVMVGGEEGVVGFMNTDEDYILGVIHFDDFTLHSYREEP